HLLGVAAGVALDIKMRRGGNRVFVVLGDGELDEGSVWEAFLVASALKLDNLVAIVDRNEFQANVRTEELIPLEPLAAKLEAFGAATTTVDGHDFGALDQAFARLPRAAGRPTAVLARTVRGRRCMEARAARWFANFTPAEVEGLLAELHGGAKTDILSPTLVVR